VKEKKEKEEESIQTLRQLNPPGKHGDPGKLFFPFICIYILYIPQVLGTEN